MDKFETSKDTLGRFAHALGVDTPNVLDTLKREDFVTDGNYLDAAAKAVLNQQSPEYRQTYRRLSDELQQRREAQEREKQSEEYKKLRAGVALDTVELGNIEQEAHRLAQADLAAGKIFSYQVGETIEKHAAELTEKAKDSKAARQQMNALFRRSSK